MAPVSATRLQKLVEQAKGRLGSTAHFATGDDVPGSIAPPVDRRPAWNQPQTRLHAQGMPLQDLAALAEKARATPAALTTEEILVLLDAGADPALVMPQVAFTPEQRDAIIRQVQRGEAITPGQIDRLRQTPAAEQVVDAPAVEPDAPAIDVATGEARPFADVGGGRLVGEDGMSLTALDDGERFVYEDGTVVDVMGNVVGRQSPGALEDVASTDVDNLAASAMEIAEEGDAPRGGTRNLTPKTAKPDALAQLGQDIFQITKPQDFESVSQRTVKLLLRQAQRYRLPDGSYDPKFLAAVNRDPAYATGRLAALEQMAGVSNADRAAEQIDTASQAVQAAGKPRRPTAAAVDARLSSIDKMLGVDAPPRRAIDSASGMDDLAAARQLAGASLPAGDWNALTEAFNALDGDTRRAVLGALPSDTRAFLQNMMDESADAPAFLPNKVAATIRTVDVAGLPLSPPARNASAGDSTTASSLIDLTASRIQWQKRTAEVEFSDMIEAARGDQAKVKQIVAQRDAARAEFDSILSDRDRLAAIARRNAEESALNDMVELEDAAKQADASGDPKQAAEWRRRIRIAETKIAEVQASFDAYSAPYVGQDGGRGLDFQDAAREANTQSQAATALRNALIGTDETYRGEKLRAQLSAAAPPQPAAVTPGARTPEFAAEDVPDAEMPTAYDQALAEATDARLARERRAPGGGLSADKRLRAAKAYLLRKGEFLPLDEAQRARWVAKVNSLTMEDLPLFLKGSDNPIPFDVRSQGSRAEYVSPSGRKRLENLKQLEDEAAKAYAELDAVEGVSEWRSAVQSADDALQKAERAAARASGTGSLAKAVQKVEEARAAYNTAVGSSPAAQAAMRRIDAANEAIDKVAPGVASNVTGVGTTDRRLNKASPAATYSDVVSGVTGFKNPDGRVMDRSSVGLDPEDARAMQSEARRVFGKDMAEFTEGAEGADEAFTVSPNRKALAQSAISIEDGGVRKPGKLGGNRSQSRTVGSGTALFRSRDFGDFNPLDMRDPDTGEPLFKDADAVAADILSRDSQYTTKDGLAQKVAKEELAKYVNQSFGGAIKFDDVPATVVLDDAENLSDFDGVDEALRAAQGGDTSPIQPVESSNVTDNLEASAVAVDDTPATDAAKPKGRRGKKSVGKKGDAASTAAGGDSPVQPVTGNRKSVEEIQAEANEVEAQARREAMDSGMKKPEADKAARRARKAHVDAEMAARGGTKPAARQPVKMTVGEVLAAARNGEAATPDATVKPVTGGDTKPVGDASANPAQAADATPSAAAANAADPTVKPVDGDGKPVDAGGKKADSNNGKSGKTDGGNVPEKKKGSLLKKAAVGTVLVGGGLIGGGIVLDRLSSGGGGGGGKGGDWRLPPGAGGPPGSGDFFPIPVGVGGDGSSLMGEEAPMTEEERITDALARLRRARAMNQEGPSQTVLNYHAGWR